MAEHLRFGGGSNASVLHPIVAAAMVIAVIILLVMPRKFLIAPLLAMSFLVPVGQQLVVGGFHVFILRIVLLAGPSQDGLLKVPIMVGGAFLGASTSSISYSWRGLYFVL
jgi:hypothetical protein